MIITNENYKSLATERLDYGDEIIFKSPDFIFRYIVRASWLEPKEGLKFETEIIVRLINYHLISKSIIDFCSEGYGYQAKPHYSEETWPDCHRNDYKAMTKLVYKIFELLEVIDSNLKTLSLTSLNKISFL